MIKAYLSSFSSCSVAVPAARPRCRPTCASQRSQSCSQTGAEKITSMDYSIDI